MDLITEKKQRLIEALDRARFALRRDVAGLGYELDLAGRTKRSIRRNVTPWLAGAALAGVVLAIFPRRGRARKEKLAGSPPARKRKGWLMPFADTLLHIAKPAMLAFAAKTLARQVENR